MVRALCLIKNWHDLAHDLAHQKFWNRFLFAIQQGLEIRGFWGLEKTVQRKTVLREVYNYVLNEIFFQKTVYLQGFCSKSVFCEVTPIDQRGFYCIFPSLFGNWDLGAIGTFWQLGPSGNWDILALGTFGQLGHFGNWDLWQLGPSDN